MENNETYSRRVQLAKVLLSLKDLTNQKQALTKVLQADMDANEHLWRNGVRVEADGIDALIVRRPSWVLEAKPILEV